MKAGMKVQETPSEHVMSIMEIREKIRLLNKCRRKMELSLIDPDNFRIYDAAHRQLYWEINELCHDVGL